MPLRSGMSDDASQSFLAWGGRVDGGGHEHLRWHQIVRDGCEKLGGMGPHVGLLGFRSDEGVRRNRGRVGAAQGPEALRRALSPMAPHPALASGAVGLVDHGDAVTHGEDLEGGQEACARLVSAALDAEGARLVVVLGGGHETAWASARGLLGSARMRGAAGGADGADDGSAPRWGVLNLDAHFDLRREERPTSGTPFLQMAEAERAAGRDLRYAVVGIAEPSNTKILFDTARELGVRWMTDVECAEAGAAGVTAFVEDFAAGLDVLYLTIDLDVLPGAVAPGVSAPAALGVEAPLVETAVRAAARTGKLALCDVVELNPLLDIDARTARAAARLVDTAVRETIGRDAPEGIADDDIQEGARR